ncbi:MAG: RNA degradosome polyphosphate kinase [Lachnospiraceae bacterium]|nr:MAG: RNA degradosome polyphosphate kinase [Lachnospiraceae bacterium]
MAVDFKDPEYYENRELSWMMFNERILNEARDPKLPLLDRFKFLSITASNLDEFFMVRVASLVDMVHAGYKKKDLAGMTAKEQLDALRTVTHEFIDRQYTTLNRALLPALEKNGVKLVDSYEDLNDEQSKYVDTYFKENVFPVLTPLAVDSSRPFPHIPNKSLNIAALITPGKNGSRLLKDAEKEGDISFATVAVPSVLPRLIALPSDSDKESDFILLDQIIEKNMSKLFLNYNVLCAFPYRVMRNADFELDEEETSDLMKEMEKQLKKRAWGEVIRLDVEENMDKRLLNTLKKNFHVSQEAIYPIHGPMDLTVCMDIYGLDGYDDLREKEFTPQVQPRLIDCDDLFAEIRKKDIFFQHPYDSFESIVDFIKQAAVDPKVLAIKQTLYRVSRHSPIIAALAKAAELGKQVTVLVELKARFDEENNIGWAKMLEKAGCHVLYGLVGLKTHSKITLVVRDDEDGIRRYVHLGTGNYNDKTAKIYTDCGILTCNELIGEDATALFNMLSGYSEPAYWNKLLVSPIWLRDGFYKLIDREIEHAKAGRKGRIVAKMNSLCDKDMIARLYEASAAGVKINLIVRGICCLKVGIPGVSENITVSSIVGTFLEHSRIFYFYNDGDEEVYMGSADWMPRNLDRRVEVVFPVEDPDLKECAKHILEVEEADNLKAYYLQPDQTYQRKDRRGQKTVGSQMTFCEEAIQRTNEYLESKDNETYTSRLFKPALPPEE